MVFQLSALLRQSKCLGSLQISSSREAWTRYFCAASHFGRRRGSSGLAGPARLWSCTFVCWQIEEHERTQHDAHLKKGALKYIDHLLKFEIISTVWNRDVRKDWELNLSLAIEIVQKWVRSCHLARKGVKIISGSCRWSSASRGSSWSSVFPSLHSFIQSYALLY